MNITRHRLSSLCFSALLFTGPLSAAEISPQQYLSHIKYLASPEMRGRGDGTPQLEKASQYIEKQFRAFRLAPVGGSYLQEFPVTTNARIGPKNSFEFVDEGKTHRLKAGEQFTPFNFSSSGAISGTMVFAGYGITAKEYNYDDYAGIDAKGKIVLLLRHEPQEMDDKSVFAGKALTSHSEFANKAINAKLHGAIGVILINDAPNHPGDADTMQKFGRTSGPNQAGIYFVQVSTGIAEPWLTEGGKNLKEIIAAIDRDLHPQSFALPETIHVALRVDVQRDVRKVHNVVAYLPGETPEYIIVGAHYDHLGLGEQFSAAPSMAGTPHPGADDNASGTAGVIELARWFTAQPRQKRGILFLCFAAEEIGLLGSQYYADHPRLPLKDAAAMINMDMIGRIRDSKVYVGGAGTGSTFKPLLDEEARTHAFRFDFSEQAGYGSSDHTSFNAKQVPVLFFFSGLHGDYHKPTDTWDKIDAASASKLLDVVGDLTSRLASGAGRPQFVRVADPRPPGLASGGGPGYGPDFGSIPDFAEIPNGVRFSDVRDGSPAAKAGLRAGDILIEFDGKPIQNLYDFTYALRAKKPGDLVLVKVLRSGQTIEAKVLLTQRR